MNPRERTIGSRLAAGLMAVSCALGCGPTVLNPRLQGPDSIPEQERPDKVSASNGPRPTQTQPVALKVHMRSGELYVLTEWRARADGSRVEGTGTRYDAARTAGPTGPVSIPVAEVALFETNRRQTVANGAMGVLMTMTTVFGVVTGICVANPKTCFGSCPTFYLEGTDPEGRPAAEGFSSSIARALEARDVDAIGAAPAGRREFVVTMRNEALESHAVRRVRLLSAPRPPRGRVLASPDGGFHPATELTPPLACRAAEGDCLDTVRATDGVERFSATDAGDLAARETLELEFPPLAGRVGLVVAGRQTLLSTQLFYQTMAYFGSRAGEYLASLERGGPAAAERAMGMARVLGGIEAEVSEGGGGFRPIGAFDEAGPIAGDAWVLPFEAAAGPLRVRLRQAKGHWRLDQVALARLAPPLVPQRLEPVSVRRGSREDARALGLLQRGDGHLVTQPGDVYRIAFALPEAPGERELFLESEGYYYEWMREEWLAEEDAEMAALVLGDPALALRRLAGRFKRQEAELERTFWASRFREGRLR